MSKFFGDVIKSVFTTKSAKIALTAFLLSVAACAVILIIFGYNYTTKDGITTAAIPDRVKELISIGFILFFIVVWFILYVQTNREAEDIYSEVREALIGAWSVKYEASNGPTIDAFKPPLTVLCTIHINPENKKLELIFDIKDNPIYETSLQTIHAVALRHDVGPKYDIFYYYSGKRKLKDNIINNLINEDKIEVSHGLDVEIFGILHFEKGITSKLVSQLNGEWFDLNGKVTQVFSLVEDIRTHSNNHMPFVPKRMSDVKTPPDGFAAKMGTIDFNRIPVLPARQ